MFRRSKLEMRVVIFAPVGRDATLLAETLEMIEAESVVATDPGCILPMLSEGAGCAIIADEALTPPLLRELREWLALQPPWSDLPFIVLTASGIPTRENFNRAQEAGHLGNFTLIERPLRPETIQSAVRAALRARMRQYEIRSRQEALLQANADLEQFAYSASHDLREPLRNIGIYSELLDRKYGDQLDEKGQEFLSAIRSSADRMNSLLSDLLSYAHASSFPEEAVHPVDANSPLKAALDNLNAAIRESDADIFVDELPAVKVHESHLSQVFQNLIGNSIKYRSDNERLRIRVSAQRTDAHWTFSVSDNGIGIPPAYKETVFGIFKRLHSNKKYSGTGMGLAICQRIVERYRGRIWVESEPGQGSVFFFTIAA